jgi:transposase InsO family protein
VTLECLRAVLDTSISGRHVVRELAELMSNAVLAWSGDVGVEWHYIGPGKPTQNGFVESFHGRMRDLRYRATTPAGLWLPLDEKRVSGQRPARDWLPRRLQSADR